MLLGVPSSAGAFRMWGDCRKEDGSLLLAGLETHRLHANPVVKGFEYEYSAVLILLVDEWRMSGTVGHTIEVGVLKVGRIGSSAGS